MTSRNQAGFTLVEVTLAMAAAVVALTALLGLLVVGHDASRSATDATLVATIAQDMFQDIRSQSFAAVNVTGTSRNLQTFNGLDGTLYFDGDGYDATAANARYRCKIFFQPDSALDQLSRVRLEIVWPSLAAAPANTNYFYFRVAAMN
jgi:uncharacterized protein (TIGR02598 family)